MKEQLIEFETAKLAKEKGFDQRIDNWYRPTMPGLYGRNAKRGGLIPPVRQDFSIILAPTQSLLQKWLREKHQIFIQPNFYLEENGEKVFECHIYHSGDKWENGFSVNNNQSFETFEKALEKGLFEALQLIKFEKL